MNSVFKQLAFWNLFTHLEGPELTEEDIEAWQDQLSQDYEIKEEVFDFEVEGQTVRGLNRIIIFNFNCGAYQLQLEYTPHPEGSEKYLYLIGPHNTDKQLMGWWNLENWHPFCLHQEELFQLLEYWQKHDPRWENPDLALVLLHDFVGFDNPNKADDFALKVYEAYQRLAVGKIRKAPQKPIAVFVYEDSQYHWKKDPKLGMVFDSKVYACYSIRNAAHAHGAEGRFPFEDWQKLMRKLKS